MTIVTIDFEASCLPRHGRSFPIEVGITREGRTQSWLIRPDESWAGWDWTAEAERLHGLTLARVQREGLPVEAVLDRLVVAVDGCRAVADSPIDQYWLEILARAAGESAPFMIDHISTVLNEHGAAEGRIAAAIAHADASHPVRHRAGCDAAWLAALIDHVAGKRLADSAMPLVDMRRTNPVSFSNNL